MTAPFLFSVDLEDVRDCAVGGHAHAPRVEHNTRRYLRFLEDRGIQGTFFVVGSVAERHPELIRAIASRGHEIACHGYRHVQLDRHTPETLRGDLERNLDVLHRCGAREVRGYRAPTFSMTEGTRWAYPILADLGFRYSSSVLPAANPLYGWERFGADPRSVDGVVELPLTLHPWLRVPLAGGVYFRVLPFWLVERGVRRLAGHGTPLLSYFHPYDIDQEQHGMVHADLPGNPLYQALMYVGRGRVFDRLERLAEFCRFTSYREYLTELRP